MMTNLSKVARSRLVDHRCFFLDLEVRYRPKIGLVGANGYDMANDKVN